MWQHLCLYYLQAVSTRGCTAENFSMQPHVCRCGLISPSRSPAPAQRHADEKIENTFSSVRCQQIKSASLQQLPPAKVPRWSLNALAMPCCCLGLNGGTLHYSLAGMQGAGCLLVVVLHAIWKERMMRPLLMYAAMHALCAVSHQSKAPEATPQHSQGYKKRVPVQRSTPVRHMTQAEPKTQPDIAHEP